MQGDVFGLVGTTLEGRYRIDSVVGEGGFGVVYRGQHLSLQHPLAIKCLKMPPGFTAQARDAFFAKFREEGQMLSRLRDCPSVVHVYDFGVTGTRSGIQAPYLVLEWLEGQTLEGFLRQRRAQGVGLLSIAEAVALLAPAFDALAFAHRQKIAHRDIKPANLFLAHTARGLAVKVLDFGIAKVMQEGDSAQQAATGTGSGFQAFSPQYGSPEQFFSRRHGASGPWTDVHALALVLVEAITGRVALEGEDMAELLTSATSPVRPTPRARGLWLPEPLEAVFAQALAVAAPTRFPDAERFYEALRQALAACHMPTPGPLPSLAPAYGYSPTVHHQPTPLPAQAQAQAPAAVGVWQQPAVPPYATPGSLTPVGAPPHGPAATGGPGMYGSPGYGYGPPGTVPASPASSAHGAPAVTSPTGGPGWTAAASQRTGTEVAPRTGTEVAVGPGPADAWRGVPPPPPPPPAQGAGRGALVAAIVVGSLLLGGIAIVGIGAMMLHTASAPITSGSAKPAAPEAAVALGIERGREILPVLPQASAPRGRWHWRLTRSGGRITRAQHVRPDGEVSEEERYEYDADGGRREHQLDAHGVEQLTTLMTREGVVTSTTRAGVTTYRGCHHIQRVFDAAGHVVETRCHASTGVLVADEDGCQALRATYNDRGLEQTTGCFALDAGGQALRPVSNRDGVHLQRHEYGAHEQAISVRYLDETGAPTAQLSDGCFGHAYDHDGAGNAVSDRCTDAHGNPRAQLGSTVATTRVDYSAAGCAVSVRYLDLSGQPTAMGELSSLIFRVTPRCDRSDEERHRRDGALTSKPDGIAVRTFGYNEQGEQIAMSCFDEQRRPVGCMTGRGTDDALRRWERDPRGRVMRERSYRPDGMPSPQSTSYPHETRMTYGDDGQLATLTFFDELSRPTVALGHTARMSFRRDALGATVSETYFGLNQAPIESSVGCHEVRIDYDGSHRLQGIACLGVDGQPRAHQGMRYRGVDWPAAASHVRVERSPVLVNVYTGPNGRPVKRVECRRPEEPCYR